VKRPNNQQGATLLDSLVQLLVLTIVGLAAIDDANMQTKMARNSQFEVESYQIALSEIMAQLEMLALDIAPLVRAIWEGTVVRVGDEIAMQPPAVTQAVAYEYIGEGLPPPGFSVDAFVGRRFELDSRAQKNNTGIFSDQTQGLNYAGPK
jgi:hypothetical protein